MSLIYPFPGVRVVPEYAQAVIAPPYDVLNSDEARLWVRDQPWSFLHISKPEIDLPEQTDPYANSVYAKGAENWQRWQQLGVLQQDPQPCYYLYRLRLGTHQQTGLVAVASVAAYNAGQIRKHELTRPDKEDDRVRHIDALNAQTGPAFLAYRQQPSIDSLVTMLTTMPPAIKVLAANEVEHTLWVVDKISDIEAISSAFANVPRLYIADGHHRSAAASRIAALRSSHNSQSTGTESYQYFLSVIFPDNQLQILDYNRVVKDLYGLTPTAFLERLQENFTLSLSNRATSPQQPGDLAMFLAGQWYYLRIHPDKIPSDDLVASLDVSLLTTYVLTPLLGITDLRRDKRIDFVGGARGLRELEQRVACGEMAVAFALYPTSVQTLMAIADADHIMPPKSTWFEPKLADGLISHSF